MATRRRYRSGARRKGKQEEGLGALLFLGVLGLWFLRTQLWAVVLLVFAAVLLVIGVVVAKRRKQRQLTLAGIGDIDQMDGRQFEERLAAHFRQQDFKVDLTPYRGDFGADLILDRDGVRTAVQAKRWKGNVGVGAVQEIVSAKGYYQCQQAMVVTNSAFTQAAQQLATANGVTLWDRAVLIRELATVAVPIQAVQDRQLQW